MNPIFTTDLSTEQIAAETRRFFQKVFSWMALGLVISGVTAFYVAATSSLYYTILGNPIVYIILILAELGLVVALVKMINHVSARTAVALFLGYSLVTGLTLSAVFLVFTGASIITTFFMAAALFAVMAIYGYITKADLTKLGHIMFVGLIGIILASLVNLFLQSSGLDFVVSIIGVIVFTGLTAYDIQKIKRFNIIGNEGTPQDRKEAIMGALTLYLDFINLFLMLLRIFGNRRD